MLFLSDIVNNAYIGTFLCNVASKAFIIPLNNSQGNALGISVPLAYTMEREQEEVQEPIQPMSFHNMFQIPQFK